MEDNPGGGVTEIMLATEKVKACQIEIANRALEVTLLVLKM